MNKKNSEVVEWLSKLTKEDLLYIIKHGLRGHENAPIAVNVEDIFDYIGCMYISELNQLNNLTWRTDIDYKDVQEGRGQTDNRLDGA